MGKGDDDQNLADFRRLDTNTNINPPKFLCYNKDGRPEWIDREGRIEVRGTVDLRRASAWVRTHFDGGRVMVDDLASPTLLQLGLPFGDVLTSSTGSRWRRAVRHPSDEARWAIVQPNHLDDRVGTALRRSPSGWRRVAHFDSADVYRYDRSTDRDGTR